MNNDTPDGQTQAHDEIPSQEHLNKLKSDIEAAKVERTRFLRLAGENREKAQRLSLDVKKIEDEKKRIEQEQVALQNTHQTKVSELKSEITNLETKKESITSDIEKLSESITELEDKKTESEERLNTQLTKSEAELKRIADDRAKASEELKELRGKRSSLQTECESLTKDKANLEANVALWRTKHNLYSKDLAGIGEENKNQQYRFIGAAAISFIGFAFLMYLLICSIKTELQLPQWVIELFQNEHGYVFSLIILIRISMVVSLFILIFVFLNLTRGFVVQLIRTQGKMSSVRMLDFLSTRVGKESIDGLGADDLLKYETDKLARQSELLAKHIPDLIDYRASEFERASNTESPHTGFRKFFTKGRAAKEEGDE